MEMHWQDPPSASRKSKWREVANELEKHPGKWALLHTYTGENAKRNAYSLAGRLRRVFGEGYEAAARSLGEEEAGVWGRKTELSDDELMEAIS